MDISKGYYDGKPIIPQNIQKMTIKELDKELEKFNKERNKKENKSKDTKLK